MTLQVHLISIAEGLVLPIRHSRPNLGRHISILHLLGAVITSLVCPDIVHEQQKRGQRTTSLSAHDSKFGGPEFGGVFGLECLRANDVAERE